MVLYHGTTMEKYNMIKKDGFIKTTSDKISQYSNFGSLKTTNGYVYLTSSFSKAIDFANRCFITSTKQSNTYSKDMARTLVVLRVEIDENKIEKDEDELNFGDSFSNDCYRYNNNILLSQTKLWIKEFSSYQDCCDYYDSISINDVEKINWMFG